MSKVILDSSALLALINEEPGANIVEALIGNIVISSVNLTEVASKFYDIIGHYNETECYLAIEPFINQVVEFDKSLAFTAAALRAQLDNKTISLGDRACLATGLKLGLPIYTADRVWAELDIPDLKIHLIR